MITSVFSRITILVFGILYPGYASFKAVRAKNIHEYVKWMMYWIVFAIFAAIETFSDTFLSWLPLYYEFKVGLVFWLISPVTNGSSILYCNFVHPFLQRKEGEIDKCISKLKQQNYASVIQFGKKAIRQCSTFIIDSIYLNSILSKPTKALPEKLTLDEPNYSVEETPKIVLTSYDGNTFQFCKNIDHLAELSGERVEIGIGKTNKRTRQVRGFDSPHSPSPGRNSPLRRGRSRKTKL